MKLIIIFEHFVDTFNLYIFVFFDNWGCRERKFKLYKCDWPTFYVYFITFFIAKNLYASFLLINYPIIVY